jgi:hypothetical protein
MMVKTKEKGKALVKETEILILGTVAPMVVVIVVEEGAVEVVEEGAVEEVGVVVAVVMVVEALKELESHTRVAMDA